MCHKTTDGAIKGMVRVLQNVVLAVECYPINLDCCGVEVIHATFSSLG